MSPKSIVDDPRCQHLTADGRRCRATRLSGRSVFCTSHSQQEQQYTDAQEVAAELLGPLDQFQTTLSVNRALGKLFSLLAKNRIPVRNAAVLAYIGQLLLRSMENTHNEIYRIEGSEGKDEIIKHAIEVLNS